MNLQNVELPEDWYALKVHQKCTLYINLKHQVASLSPVFELHQTQMILKDILGLSVDFDLVDKTLTKIKNQINLNTNKIPFIDDELNTSIKDQIKDQEIKNRGFDDIIRAKVHQLNIMVPTDQNGYDTVTGVQPDVCSLLSQIAGQFFQCIPVYEEE